MPKIQRWQRLAFLDDYCELVKTHRLLVVKKRRQPLQTVTNRAAEFAEAYMGLCRKHGVCRATLKPKIICTLRDVFGSDNQHVWPDLIRAKASPFK